MNKLTALILFFTAFIAPAYSQLSFSQTDVNLGVIAEAYEIKGDLILKNTSAKKIFLMRADAEKGVKIYTSKKTLQPNDTCLLVISFVPGSAGKFRKKIGLVSSDKAEPYEVSLSGNLNKFKNDDKTACYYFGSRPPQIAVNTNPIIIPQENTKRDNSNKLPDNPPKTTQPEKTPDPIALQPKPTGFTAANYNPNNILFLVDVSSSMRDSLKLPLMKRALHALINEARNIDTITFVTYAVKVTVLKEAVSGADKSTLHTIVDSLKAKGMTSGNKAILFSQQLAQKHFISDGNNQIFLATDGEFKFVSEDNKLWKDRQLSKKIILTTVAFGNEKPALKNLKDIAAKGEGSFIHIGTGAGCEEKLLNEIKMRSRK